MADTRNKVAILFPADPAAETAAALEETRYADIAAALGNAGLQVVGVPYADEAAAAAREQLLSVHGVLVWVNPVDGGRDRRALNELLAEVAATGVFVSAHPDVIAKMGTKEVLHRTRAMGWGSDTRLYATIEAFRQDLPTCLAEGAPRVLKHDRGNGGNGIWKVELAAPVPPGTSELLPDTPLRIRHAKRGSPEEEVPLGLFLKRWDTHFQAGGQLIDQVYQPRLPEGIIRCYLAGDRVAGFGEQLINALYPAPADTPPGTLPPEPGPRLYYPATRADFQPLRHKMETEFLPDLYRTIKLARSDLPVIWDADFMFGPKDAAGTDTYVLCEINVSSVYPFPEEALAVLAGVVRGRLRTQR